MPLFFNSKTLLLMLFVFFLSGCTEEKAKALQILAESFKNEADLSCSMAATSIITSVSMPRKTPQELSDLLITEKSITSNVLDQIESETNLVDEAMKSSLDALDRVCIAHRKLSAIYTDLPRGYLFASNDIKNAQRHVTNVTVRFARLASILATNPNIGKNNAVRIKIIEAGNKALAVADEKTRLSLVEHIVEDIQKNLVNESRNRNQLMTQFAKTVSIGDKLSRASVEFDKLSLSDLIQSLKEFTSLYRGVTGQTESSKEALDFINKIESQIRNDPVLKPLLDAELN